MNQHLRRTLSTLRHSLSLSTAHRRIRRQRRRLILEPLETRELMAVASLSGIVTQDLTGNGFSNDDTGLSGVTVQLYRDNGDDTFNANSDTLVTSTTSGSNGAFSFSNLSSDTYFIREVPGSGQSQTAGPTTYKVRTVESFVFKDDGTTIDDFSQPTPAEFAPSINQASSSSQLLKQSGAGMLGGNRVLLVTPSALNQPSSNVTAAVGGGQVGLFSGAATAIGTLLYDGVDSNTAGANQTLTNAQNLQNEDLTDGGVNNGVRIDFLNVDPAASSTVEYQFSLTGPGSATATYTGTVSRQSASFTQFIPFTSFTTANGFSFTNVTSLQLRINSGSVQDADTVLSLLAAEDQTTSGYNFANTVATLPVSIAGTVFEDFDRDGIIDTIDQNSTRVVGAIVTLTSTSNTSFTPQSQTIAQGGTYSFTNLDPGTYVLTVTPAPNMDSVSSTPGTVNSATVGTKTSNTVLSAIMLASGQDGVEYNFGELVTPPTNATKRSFLASRFRTVN